MAPPDPRPGSLAPATAWPLSALAALGGCVPPADCDAPALSSNDAEFPYTEAIPRFDLELSDEARAALPTRPRESGADVPATLTWNGERFAVGLDLKGNTSFRPIDGKAAFKIDVHAFDPDATFHGVRRLTLDNMVGDRTGLAAYLGLGVYAAMGLPAPRRAFACVSVNGEEYGLYSLVETMDEQFLQRAFVDPGGSLFDRNGEADLTPAGVGAFAVEELGTDAGTAELRALAEAVSTAPEVLPVIEAHFDADALLGALAVDLALANEDGYARNANNFLLYHEPAFHRWWLLPWGIDRAFQPPGDQLLTTGERPGILAARCQAEPACAARLDQRIADVAETMDVLPGEARAVAAHTAALFEADPRAETTSLDRWSAQQELFAFVDARAAVLR